MPYEESDATGPLSVYGETKLEGDQAIIASGCAHIILRTTWVYDIRGKNFLRTMLRLATRKRRAADGRRPVWRADLGAHAWPNRRPSSGEIRRARSRRTGAWQSGLFHLTAGGRTSWAGFAQAILEEYEALLRPGRPKPANSAAR